MRVVAHLRAKAYGGEVKTIDPYMEITSDGGRVSGPVTLDDGTVVQLAGIQADAGAILLQFEKAGAPVVQASLLVLEVSRKPLVGLVWIGSVLTLAGALMALYFRSRVALAVEQKGGRWGVAEGPSSAVEKETETVS
jgi:hypothetical protein